LSGGIFVERKQSAHRAADVNVMFMKILSQDTH